MHTRESLNQHKLAFKPGQRLFRASSYFTSLDKDNRINLQQIDLLKLLRL